MCSPKRSMTGTASSSGSTAAAAAARSSATWRLSWTGKRSRGGPHGMLGEYAAREGGTRIMHALKHSQLLRRKLQEFSEIELTELLTRVFLEGHQGALQAFDDAPPRYSFPLGSRLEQQYALQYVKGSGDKCYTNPFIGTRLLEFGTSATLALVQGRSLVVADVGDSLAVLGREEGDQYVGEIVSVRHFGWDEGERQRLQEQCGDSVSIAGEDGYLTVEEGRLRGFQLAMTRALGHRLLADYGVIPDPSVTFHQLRPEHVCLIVATDGVWEVLSPSEAVKIVCDHLAEGYSATAAAAELCREAVRLASSVRHAGEAAQADNTTAAVLVFPEL
ncbi:phosphatase 2C 12 [Chlorella sorokiniana]|uniref:Phosphatase 2C 12 n=1 Tax=Chlorella sorokiniana TaxID=3076 RepID=A0A2P6TC35_CHLSO|nr:phosphatase 2C 12 [Chlorella sorokiniana]|eukprot:PRW20200.1 phosphatase 2C 12 [Chlorella sorokiniana]